LFEQGLSGNPGRAGSPGRKPQKSGERRITMAYSQYVLVCGGTGCESSGAHTIYCKLKAAAEERGLSDQVQIVKTGCFGFCEKGPIVKVLPDESFYVEVKAEDADE